MRALNSFFQIGSIYNRNTLSIPTLLVGVWEWKVAIRNKVPDILIAQWIVTSLLLAIFPQMPVATDTEACAFIL